MDEIIYPYNRKQPVMKQSAVLYLDILGFSEMIRESFREGNGDKVLQSVKKALDKAISNAFTLRGGEGTDLSSRRFIELKQFTDNIVVGYPISQDGEAEIGHFFTTAAFFQWYLVEEGFFVRGSITVGSIYMDDEIVFGPALLDAYELETKKAIFPRIVLSKEVKDKCLTFFRYYGGDVRETPYNTALMQDADSEWFVNYLDVIYEYYKDEGHGDGSLILPHLKKHKEMVSEKLLKYRSQSRIWEKYAWLARYHNYFCTTFFPQYSALLINAVDYAPYPCLLSTVLSPMKK